MKSEFELALAQITEDTFASMAFVLPVSEEECQETVDTTKVAAHVAFSGPLTGSLELRVSRSMLPTLAANMLGLENPRLASPAQQQDALKEISNVICGNLLPRLTSPTDVFSMHEPRFVENSDAAAIPAGSELEVHAHICLDCGRAEVTLLANQPSGHCQLVNQLAND